MLTFIKKYYIIQIYDMVMQITNVGFGCHFTISCNGGLLQTFLNTKKKKTTLFQLRNSTFCNLNVIAEHLGKIEVFCNHFIYNGLY